MIDKNLIFSFTALKDIDSIEKDKTIRVTYWFYSDFTYRTCIMPKNELQSWKIKDSKLYFNCFPNNAGIWVKWVREQPGVALEIQMERLKWVESVIIKALDVDKQIERFLQHE